MAPDQRNAVNHHALYVWTITRWAFLVFNLAIVTGFLFYLQWQRNPEPGIVWTTRILIVLQLSAAVGNWIFAMRKRIDETTGIELTAEAFIYLGLSCLGATTMALSMY